MRKFKEGDGIVRTKGDYNWAPLGYKAIVLKGYFYIDALGKSNNEVADDFWELAEDTSKPVTVTDAGNIYEIGKYYLFSDDGIDWASDKLKSIQHQDDFKFKAGFNWKLIKELSDVGTITPAPIDLIDGNAYMFDYKGASYIGIYTSPPHRFIQVDGFTLSSYCTNIRPMTVAESK
jgi:hypothetical protein